MCPKCLKRIGECSCPPMDDLFVIDHNGKSTQLAHNEQIATPLRRHSQTEFEPETD